MVDVAFVYRYDRVDHHIGHWWTPLIMGGVIQIMLEPQNLKKCNYFATRYGMAILCQHYLYTITSTLPL